METLVLTEDVLLSLGFVVGTAMANYPRMYALWAAFAACGVIILSIKADMIVDRSLYCEGAYCHVAVSAFHLLCLVLGMILLARAAYKGKWR